MGTNYSDSVQQILLYSTNSENNLSLLWNDCWNAFPVFNLLNLPARCSRPEMFGSLYKKINQIILEVCQNKGVNFDLAMYRKFFFFFKNIYYIYIFIFPVWKFIFQWFLPHPAFKFLLRNDTVSIGIKIWNWKNKNRFRTCLESVLDALGLQRLILEDFGSILNEF